MFLDSIISSDHHRHLLWMCVRCTERKGAGFKPYVRVSAVWTYEQCSYPGDLCQQVARMNKDGFSVSYLESQ